MPPHALFFFFAWNYWNISGYAFDDLSMESDNVQTSQGTYEVEVDCTKFWLTVPLSLTIVANANPGSGESGNALQDLMSTVLSGLQHRIETAPIPWLLPRIASESCLPSNCIFSVGRHLICTKHIKLQSVRVRALVSSARAVCQSRFVATNNASSFAYSFQRYVASPSHLRPRRSTPTCLR